MLTKLYEMKLSGLKVPMIEIKHTVDPKSIRTLNMNILQFFFNVMQRHLQRMKIIYILKYAKSS